MVTTDRSISFLVTHAQLWLWLDHAHTLSIKCLFLVYPCKTNWLGIHRCTGEIPKECVYLKHNQKKKKMCVLTVALQIWLRFRWNSSQVSHYLSQHTPRCSALYTNALFCNWTQQQFSSGMQGCRVKVVYLFSLVKRILCKIHKIWGKTGK